MVGQSTIQLFNLLFQQLVITNHSIKRNAGYLARQEIERILAPLRADPLRLEPFGFKVYSQNDEDGILAEIFKRVGIRTGIFCEIGVQDGLECNSLFLIHQGWRGTWVEADETQIPAINEKFQQLLTSGQLHVQNEYAKPENINRLLTEGLSRIAGKADELDFLSIDVDGMDFYLLQSLELKPKVICIEYNAKFPAGVIRCPVFDPNYRWQGTDYMGASLSAFDELARTMGYTLVGTNITGANAFFVRNDLTANRFVSDSSSEALYNPPRYYLMIDHFIDQVGHRADFGAYESTDRYKKVLQPQNTESVEIKKNISRNGNLVRNGIEPAVNQWMPLNYQSNFETWPPLDAGKWIEFNPSCIQLPSGRWLGVIRRDNYPPVPGMGTIWTVELDDCLRPIGTPHLLLARSEDPRAIVVGSRVFIFYCVIEHSEDGHFSGASMCIAECLVNETDAPAFLHIHQILQLPKNPLQKPSTGTAHENWEKNWVPFPLSSEQIGIIYSHAPWTVLTLNVNASSNQRNFENAYQGPNLEWAWGQIRGGTVPVPAPSVFGENLLITFYHSSARVGSRKLYFVGACIFDAKAPFTPRLITHSPLLVAPYNTGAHQFGWNFAGSVVFPLGAQPLENGYRLLCGRDDGSIATFLIENEALLPRLEPISVPLILHNSQSETLNGSHEPLIPWPFDESALHLARLLVLMHHGHGVFIDAAPGDGAATARLASHFERSFVFVPDESAKNRIKKLFAINEINTAELFIGDIHIHEDIAHEIKLICINDGAAVETVLERIQYLLIKHKPVLAFTLPAENEAADKIQRLLSDCAYTCEAIFPFTPLSRLAIPSETRADYDWLV